MCPDLPDPGQGVNPKPREVPLTRNPTQDPSVQEPVGQAMVLFLFDQF